MSSVGTFAWIDDAGAIHSLNRPYLTVRKPTNLFSVPPLRGEDVVIASYPGEGWLEKQHSARRIDLELLFYHPDELYTYQMIQEFAQAFGIHNQGQLVHYRPDGTTVKATAQVNGWTSPRQDMGPFTPEAQTANALWWAAVVPFNLADPYFYGTTVTSGPTDLSSGTGTQVIVHPGTSRGWKAVFTFTGPCSNPKIVNAANGWTLQVLVTVPSGQSLVIDCSAWTALLNGTSVIGSVVHSGGFEFMMFEPGSNSLTVTGGGGSGAALTTTFAPPYF